MSKFVVFILAFSLISITAAHLHPGVPVPYIANVADHSSGSVAYGDDSQYIQLYTSLADGVFNFIAKLIRGKNEIILWIKRAILNLFISGFANLRYLMVHNANFVHGVIGTGAQLMKVLLTSQPYDVSNVNSFLQTAENNMYHY